MEFKGTQGKWFTRVSGYGDYIAVDAESGIKQSDNKTLFYKTFKPEDNKSEYYLEQKSNAQLIAAAPELLKACITIKESYESDGMEQMESRDKVIYESCITAINKAIG